MNAMAQVLTSELQEGMITADDTYSDDGKMIVPKDTVLTKNLITRLVNLGVVNVEISDGEEASKAEDAEEPFQLVNEELLKKPEYKKFKRRYENQVRDLEDHLNDIVTKNAPIQVDAMLNNTLTIVHAAGSPLSVMSMMATLQNYDDSTFHHSLNVSLICNIFAGWLGFEEKVCELLTLCGLFHDIGKLLIPPEIIKKPGKLTDEEFKVIKTHPTLGYNVLKNKKMDPHIQLAALMHHEKADGSGYPLGLTADKIDWAAQIVTIADIYEALTATRVYRGPINPFKVISMFEEDGLKKYNPEYLLTFLEHVVNSYMNCKVKLSNGVEGDIVYINKVRLSKPMIKTSDNFIDLSRSSDISIESVQS